MSAPGGGEARVWSVRRAMWLGTLTTLALAAVFVGWGMLTTIAGAVVTSGQIEVEKNRQIVQHADGGTVEAILVAENATVAAGDVLLRLDGSALRSELAVVESQYFEILARRGRLEAERDDAPAPDFPPDLTEAAAARPELAALRTGQERLFAARADTLARQLEQLERRAAQTARLIEGIDAQRAAIVRQHELLQEELGSQQALLAKGLAQAARVLALQREEARLQGTLGELAASRAQAEERITETEVEALRITAARREEANAQLRDIGFRELELAERRHALVERIARLEVRAPVSGVVLGLRVTTPRAVIRAADPILFLIPQDRPLVIATRVPTLHIDQVRPGQAAKLMFTALSAATTPELEGVVTTVSADVLVDEATQMPYYRAEIELLPGQRDRLGAVALLPGMPVDAFIMTDDRSPMSYLVRPFTDYFNRAFRES